MKEIEIIEDMRSQWLTSRYVSGNAIRRLKPTNHRFWPRAMEELGIIKRGWGGMMQDYWNESMFNGDLDMVRAIATRAKYLASQERKARSNG